MKKIHLLLLSVTLCVFSACHNDIWDAIDGLDSRVTKLEELCKEMNTNITSLQTIVSVLQSNDFITGIVEIKKNGEVIGYTITFGKHDPITIYHGQDGKDGQNGTNGADGQDGVTPIIGVAQDSDGVYYWTLNGEWLLDNNGNKLPVSGTNGKDGQNGSNGQDGTDGKDGQDGTDGKDGQDGADGKDGVTPQLKIEDDYWYVSYDNGLTWELLGKAVGEEGKDGVDGADGKDGENGFVSDAVFESVQVTATAVKFVLPDGQAFEIPMFQKAALIFDLENQEVPIRAGETIRLSYRLENSNASTVVSASSDGNYKACVIPKDHTKGIIEITSPAVYVDGFINVIVTDGENYSYVKVINVYEKGMHFVNGYEYAVPSQGRHLRNFVSG